MKNSVDVNIGPGFLGLLGLLFIGLKLTGYIAWSWWWVLAPIWIPFAFVALFFLIIGISILVGAKVTLKKMK